MQRYFVGDSWLTAGQRIAISGEDFHHIVRVMRMKPLAQIQVVASGQVWQAQIAAIGKESVEVCVLELLAKDAEPPIHITLIQGLPKGEKIDSIIRQACEVGITHLAIFTALRSVGCVPWDKREQRLTRWRKMAKESAEQAQRSKIPQISQFDSLQDALRNLADKTEILVPYEAQDQDLPSLKQVVQTLRTKQGDDMTKSGSVSSAAIVIGPEGGFDPREIELVKASRGHLLTLGPRIMRTETAGIVVAAIVLYDLFG